MYKEGKPAAGFDERAEARCGTAGFSLPKKGKAGKLPWI